MPRRPARFVRAMLYTPMIVSQPRKLRTAHRSRHAAEHSGDYSVRSGGSSRLDTSAAGSCPNRYTCRQKRPAAISPLPSVIDNPILHGYNLSAVDSICSPPMTLRWQEIRMPPFDFRPVYATGECAALLRHGQRPTFSQSVFRFFDEMFQSCDMLLRNCYTFLGPVKRQSD